MARGNRMEMTWRLGGNLPSGQLQKRHGDTCWPQHPHVFWDGEAACQNRSPHSYRKKIAARGWPGVYLKDCNHRETFRPYSHGVTEEWIWRSRKCPGEAMCVGWCCFSFA